MSSRLPVPASPRLTPEFLGGFYAVDPADVRVLVADYLGYDYLHDEELPRLLAREVGNVLSPNGERTHIGVYWPPPSGDDGPHLLPSV